MLKKCKRCLSVFPNWCRLKRHISGARICEVVDEGQELSKEQLLEDLKKMKADERASRKRTYKCEHCLKVLNSKQAFDYHQEKVCKNRIPFSLCPLVINPDHIFTGHREMTYRRHNIFILIRDTYLQEGKDIIRGKGRLSCEVFDDYKWKNNRTSYVDMCRICLEKIFKCKKVPIDTRRYAKHYYYALQGIHGIKDLEKRIEFRKENKKKPYYLEASMINDFRDEISGQSEYLNRIEHEEEEIKAMKEDSKIDEEMIATKKKHEEQLRNYLENKAYMKTLLKKEYHNKNKNFYEASPESSEEESE